MKITIMSFKDAYASFFIDQDSDPFKKKSLLKQDIQSIRTAIYCFKIYKDIS